MRIFLFWLSIVISIGVIIYQERFTIANNYASLFIVDTATKGADAILILSGSVESRAIKAVELYKKGYAKQIWTTKPYEGKTKYPHILKSQNSLLANILSYEKIDKLYILPTIKDGATSTFDEAYDLAYFLQGNDDVKKVIIVTDGYHTARTQIAFEKIFKKMNISTKLEYAPAFSSFFDGKEWYKYESSFIRLIVLEPLALLYYYFHDSNSDLYVNM
jgi:uncharacterized SAM-binding protein YcdF (DUF218 family)